MKESAITLKTWLSLGEYQQSNRVKISEAAMADLTEMLDLTISTVKESITALGENNEDAARRVVEKENQIDKMERKLRKKHILRLNDGLCSGQAGVIFVDITSNLERIGDHAVNIAEAVLGEEKH